MNHGGPARRDQEQAAKPKPGVGAATCTLLMPRSRTSKSTWWSCGTTDDDSARNSADGMGRGGGLPESRRQHEDNWYEMHKLTNGKSRVLQKHTHIYIYSYKWTIENFQVWVVLGKTLCWPSCISGCGRHNFHQYNVSAAFPQQT
jgi:hypothetical protein